MFLTVTPTGNIVLYDGNLVNNYPGSPSTVIWQSGTASAAAPFYLTMQDVRAPCLPWMAFEQLPACWQGGVAFCC